MVTTLAGCAGARFHNGTGSAARFGDPEGVAVDNADTFTWRIGSNEEIRKITPSGVVTTLAGSVGQNGSSDGTGICGDFIIPRVWWRTARAMSTWRIG